MKEKDREDLVKYRIQKARTTFDEVSLHIKNELWNTAVNRVYYACYYAVTALLVGNNIKATTHSGVRLMFGLHFVKPGIIKKRKLASFIQMYLTCGKQRIMKIILITMKKM